MSQGPPDPPLQLTGGGLQAARRALASPERARLRSGWVLACAVLMAAAALSLCAVLVLQGGPADAPPSGVRTAVAR